MILFILYHINSLLQLLYFPNIGCLCSVWHTHWRLLQLHILSRVQTTIIITISIVCISISIHVSIVCVSIVDVSIVCVCVCVSIVCVDVESSVYWLVVLLLCIGILFLGWLIRSPIANPNNMNPIYTVAFAIILLNSTILSFIIIILMP